MRYVLPIFPFAFVWASQVARAVPSKHWKTAALGAVALVWSVGSSLWIYPHSLSYFNESVGGPPGGHAHLIHSNIDWGQDLLYLQRWLDDHPEARPLRLAYHGRIDPRLAGIEFSLPPLRSAPDDSDSDIGPLEPGWYAVSVNFMRGFPFQAPDGTGSFRPLERGACSYFQSLEPVAMAGYSIYIYKIPSPASVVEPN